MSCSAGRSDFQVLGVAVADTDLAGGVLLGKVRVEPLVAIASELACVRRLVGGEVERVREIALVGVRDGRRGIATGRGVGVRLGDGANVVGDPGVLRGLQATGSDGATALLKAGAFVLL